MGRPSLRRSQSGAVLIHVGLAILVLLAFSALAVDYGIMWTSRTQAQAAADAGALAGAVSLAYGRPPDSIDGYAGDAAYVTARQQASAVARQNRVWGEAPRVSDVSQLDVIFLPPDGTNGCPESTATDRCVRVNAYRNQAGDAGGEGGTNIPLPTFFAKLVNVDKQGVQATATATILSGNLVPRCVKPFALPDRWLENGTTPSQFGDVFDSPPDVYNPEVVRWRFPDDYGATVLLYVADGLTSSWAQLISIGGKGGTDVAEAISGCVDVSVRINPGWDEIVLNKPGLTVGNIRKGIDDLKEAYPLTLWDHSTGALVCGDPGGCDNPRIGAVPIFDPSLADAGRETVEVLDMIGVYIEGRGDDAEVMAHHPEVTVPPLDKDGKKLVVGHIVPFAALRSGTAGPPRPSSFARTVVLVR